MASVVFSNRTLAWQGEPVTSNFSDGVPLSEWTTHGSPLPVLASGTAYSISVMVTMRMLSHAKPSASLPTMVESHWSEPIPFLTELDKKQLGVYVVCSRAGGDSP